MQRYINVYINGILIRLDLVADKYGDNAYQILDDKCDPYSPEFEEAMHRLPVVYRHLCNQYKSSIEANAGE